MKTFLALTGATALILGASVTSSAEWKHLSSTTGDIAVPNRGTQQTSATVFDIDKDGVNDFVITERTAAPSVVWYRRSKDGWSRGVIEPGLLRPEAGATFGDIDGDGDLDFIAGADGGGELGNQVWWWENPYPHLDPATGWKRHTIKRSGGASTTTLCSPTSTRTEAQSWSSGTRAGTRSSSRACQSTPR